jgi:hypothetical protein
MNKTCLFLLSLGLFSGFSVSALAEEINLSGRKDRVMTIGSRHVVLEVSSGYLDKEGRDFLSVITEIKNPYAYALAPVEVARPSINTAGPSGPQAPVVYGNESVLQAVAASFSKQVRGTLAKGSIRYLQLQGGSLLQSGASFPVKLPALNGQSFTVTLTDIVARGYTLQLEDIDLYVPFEEARGQSPSAVKFTGE